MLLLGAFGGIASAVASPPPRVAIVVLPRATTVGELGRIPGMGLGLMSAAIGRPPAAQTYVDVSQGNRLSPSLYSGLLPKPALVGAPGSARRVNVLGWPRIAARAAGAPSELTPGLLASSLEQAGIPVRAATTAKPALMAADEQGHLASDAGCATSLCPGLTVTQATLGELHGLINGLRGGDLVVAFSAPRSAKNHELAVGIAGAGFDGQLTSESTHTGGLVLSTDLAPTILRRFGVAVPAAVAGQPVTTDDSPDAGALEDLDTRLAQIAPRRHTVIGVNLMIWVLAALAGAAIWRRRGLRLVIPLLAGTLAFAPFMMLVAPAFEPSELAERLMVGAGSPALAALALALAGPWGALAIGAAVSVGGYAVDVVAGSNLTTISLMGPNPSLGVRFYGIGNELEAMGAALTFTGTGAALQRWGSRITPRRAALVFALVGLAVVVAFAPGRFGADVGAAIDVPFAAAAAAAVCLGLRRSRALLILLLPAVMVALLAAADLVTGGNSHLTRSVLQAGGFHNLGDVVQRRLRLSAMSFSRYAGSAQFWVAVVVVLIAFARRRVVAGWYARAPLAWAGLVGAVAGTAVGTLANDSGALLLMIGAAFVASAVGVAWASQEPADTGTDPAPVRPLR